MSTWMSRLFYCYSYLTRMKIAFVLYDGITMLDFIGIYDPLTRLRHFMDDLELSIHAMTPTIADSFGLQVGVDHVQTNLASYDVLVIPGGFGTRALIADKAFLEWIKTAKSVPLKTSICTGSLILGAAGFLEGRTATTHFEEYEALEAYCHAVSKERIVEDEDVITAGAVASSLDLGLYLCQKWVGEENTAWIRRRMDYHG